MINHKPIRYSWSRLDTALLVILLAGTSLLLGLHINVGGFWWTDESRHAMDGAFFLDLFQDRPFANLYDYSIQYFIHYPALGFAWYPPFFAFIEGLVFAAFGVSEFSARLTVILFCLIGISAWYIWSRPIWGRIPTFLACLFFLLNPYVLLWGRSVMLEIPGMAMIFLTLLSFHYYLRKPTHFRSVTTGIVIAAMLLTKQITVFILPVLICYAYLAKTWKKLLLTQSFWAYIITVTTVLLLLMHAIKFGTTALGGLDENANTFFSSQIIGRLTISLRAIWAAYPLPFIILLSVGVFVVTTNKRNPGDYLILAWILSWLIFFTLISKFYNNTLRYTIYLTPALGLLSIRAFDILPKNSVLRQWAIGLLIIFYAGYGYSKVIERPYFVSGYHDAAEYILKNTNNAPILFCCKHDGNFIFHVRKGDSKRNKIILRADKILVSMAIIKQYGVKSYINNEHDLYKVLDKYGIETIVTENKDLINLPEFKLLLNSVENGPFEKIKEININSNIQEFNKLHLNIYHYTNRKPIENNEILIPMPHIGRTFRIKTE